MQLPEVKSIVSSGVVELGVLDIGQGFFASAWLGFALDEKGLPDNWMLDSQLG